MLGEMVAGDSIYIRAGQTLSLSTANSKFEIPEGLTIRVEGGAEQTSLWSQMDSLAAVLYTIPFRGNKKIQHNTTYTVTAFHEAMGTATAVVKIPSPIAATVDTQSVVYNGLPSLMASVTINDPAGEANYYVVEAVKQYMWLSQLVLFDSPVVKVITDTFYSDIYVRQNLYTDDANTENYIRGNITTLNRRILLTDQHFDGRMYKTNVYVPRDTISDSFQTTNKGRVILMVKSVSADYYEFLKAYEQYEPLSGFNTNSAPVKLEGNIKGGYGMIGGASKKQFYYLLDSLK